MSTRKISDKYYLLLAIVFSFILSGCVVRTYTVTKDRPDQNLKSGNRGYVKGVQPADEEKPRKLIRQTKVMEIELHLPIKFDKKPKDRPARPKTAEIIPGEMIEPLARNRGYITESETPTIIEPAEAAIEKYTTQKDDTLQKISEKFYGTTKKWNKIYQANRDVLKNPDMLSVGQVLNVPVEILRKVRQKANAKAEETIKENLK